MPSPIVVEKHTIKMMIQDKIIILSQPFNNLGDAQNYLNNLQDMLNNHAYQLSIDSLTSSLQPY